MSMKGVCVRSYSGPTFVRGLLVRKETQTPVRIQAAQKKSHLPAEKRMDSRRIFANLGPRPQGRHGHRCALVCLNLQQHRGRGCEVFERAQSRFRTRMQRLRTHAPKMQSSTHRRVHLHAVHACMRLYVSAQLRPYLQVIVTTQGPGEQERCLKLRSQDHPGSSACRAIRDLNRN